ncbi:MAG: hypothetical protein IJF38_01505 [Clostridia bacterium]|nr:hypothetical protein [Clostridia bacterium]
MALFSFANIFQPIIDGASTLLSVLTVALALAIMIRRLRHYKRDMILTPFRCLFAGVFISSFIWWLPIEFAPVFSMEQAGFLDWSNAFFSAIHGSLSLFVLEGSVDSSVALRIAFAVARDWQGVHYALGVLLSVVAPLLTFGFILTFFRNLLTHLAYRLKVRLFNPEVHVFSELNERSIALAKSIADGYKYTVSKEGEKREVRWPTRRYMIVFTDAFEKNEEENADLFDKARELGAILFKKDIASIGFYENRHYFYLISENESEELRHAEQLIERYSKYEFSTDYDICAKVYLFSNGSRGRCFLDSYDKKSRNSMALQVVRINDIRALIYDDLDKSGISLFEKAKQVGDTRIIRAVIVGLGMYGLEMLKALLWYCQVPGYRIEIKAFDENPEVVSRFRASCPEIMLGNEYPAPEGDMNYSLEISCASVGTQEFKSAIEECKRATFIFVCLGDDGVNISTSINIRSWLKMLGCAPDIKTVVYNTGLKTRMTSSQSSEHNIEIIGDVEGFYSVDTVINSALSGTALEVHKRWYGEGCNPNSLYMYQYGYYSSLANALHRGLREKILGYCNTEGADKKIFSCFNDPHADIYRVVSLANENATLKALSRRLTLYNSYLNAAVIGDELSRLVKDGYGEPLNILLGEEIDKLDSSRGNAYLKKHNALVGIRTSLVGDCIRATLDAMLADIAPSELIVCIDKVRKSAGLGAGEYDFFRLDRAEQERLFALILPHARAAFKEKTSAIVKIDLDKLISAKAETGDAVPDILDSEECADTLEDALMAYRIAYTFATVEHIRWNAYMRTEGFRYFREKDLAHNMHNNLVPVDELCFSDYVKDL